MSCWPLRVSRPSMSAARRYTPSSSSRSSRSSPTTPTSPSRCCASVSNTRARMPSSSRTSTLSLSTRCRWCEPIPSTSSTRCCAYTRGTCDSPSAASRCSLSATSFSLSLSSPATPATCWRASTAIPTSSRPALSTSWLSYPSSCRRSTGRRSRHSSASSTACGRERRVRPTSTW